MRSILSLCLALASFSFLAGCDDNSARNKARTKDDWVRAPEVGEKAPNIDGEDLDGNFFRLFDSEYKGKVILIDFWATWCKPCREFLPHGKEIVKRFKDKPFAALAVNLDDQATQPKSGDLAMRNWADPKGSISRNWGVAVLPTIILIDHKGIIRKKYLGPPGRELDEAIARLVKNAENDRAQQPVSKNGKPAG